MIIGRLVGVTLLIMLPNEVTNRPFDIIFCRNVFIYFQKQVIEDVVKKIAMCLLPGGLLFIGLSENLNGIDTPLSPLGNSVFLKP